MLRWGIHRRHSTVSIKVNPYQSLKTGWGWRGGIFKIQWDLRRDYFRVLVYIQTQLGGNEPNWNITNIVS